MIIMFDQLQPLARGIVDEAITLITDRGLSDGTLSGVGALLAKLAWRLPPLTGDIEERELWREIDGTFELVLRILPGHQQATEAVGYDTWSVFAPVTGRILFGSRQQGPITLTLGDSHAFASGDIVKIEAVSEGASLLCLYGIAREHLPPPVRQRLYAKAV